MMRELFWYKQQWLRLSFRCAAPDGYRDLLSFESLSNNAVVFAQLCALA